MSDDLGKKIKQITDLLGQDTVAEGVKGLLSMLGNSNTKEDVPSQSSKQVELLPTGSEDARNNRVEQDDTVNMIRKVKKVMDGISHGNDPRVNLLNALKPYLSKNRQSKLNSCVKLLSVTSLSKLIDDDDISSFFK